jgi:hypothetical protein
MPSNINNVECWITGYDVTIKESDTVAGTLELSIADSCNTLHDNARVKAILINDGVTQDPMASCVYAHKCAKGGPGMSFVNRSGVLSVDPAVSVPGATVTMPGSPITKTVTLPMGCGNVFA